MSIRTPFKESLAIARGNPFIFALFSGFVTIFFVRLYNEIELSGGASPEVEA